MKPVSDQIIRHTPLEPKYGKQYDYTLPISLTDPWAFTKGQPYDTYAEMREHAPIAWHPSQKDPFGNEMGGFWAVTDYDGVIKVSKDSKTFSSQRAGIQIYEPNEDILAINPLARAAMNNMIAADGDAHVQMRRPHLPFFKPGYVESLKSKVAAFVDSRCDEIAKTPSADLVETFSAEIPLFTLAEILGVPEADRPKLKRWMEFLEMAQIAVNTADASIVSEEFLTEFETNVGEMFEYGLHALQSKRDNKSSSDEDLMAKIAWTQLNGQLLSNDFLNGSWLLIVFAGNDTSRNSISGTLKLLSDNQEQRDLLLRDESLFPNLVNEGLRMVSPVIHMRRSVAVDGVEIHGQKLGENERVVVYYPAANRDPAVFANPDSFDLRRDNSAAHVAFGYGEHLCLGLRVARMQLEVAFRGLLNRFPNIEYTGGMECAPNYFVHAISKLPVKHNS